MHHGTRAIIVLHLNFHVTTISLDLLKPFQNKKGLEVFQVHHFRCLFLQLAVEKKTKKNRCTWKIFLGPSYFVTALVLHFHSKKQFQKLQKIQKLSKFICDFKAMERGPIVILFKVKVQHPLLVHLSVNVLNQKYIKLPRKSIFFNF